MLVTEDEAKTKRCQQSFGDTNVSPQGHIQHVPFPPDAISYSSPSGGFALNTSPSMCIGSACMAWRWHAWTHYEQSPDDPRHSTAEARVSTTHGFCGKSGRPQGYGNPTAAPPKENR